MSPLRRAAPADLPRLTAIYNQAIAAGTCTCDTLPFAPLQRRAWFDSHQGEGYPLWVWQEGDDVAGYVYLSPYREGRAALATVAEVSYYLDFSYHERGLGSRLLTHAMAAAKDLGYETLLAILLSCNAPSIGLLKKHGFQMWGKLPGVAQLSAGTYDHLYYGRHLT